MDPASGWRRLGAFAIDWLVLAVYAATLGAISWFGLDLGRDLQTFDPVRGQVLGLLAMTLPFTLYFAVCESSAGRASLGKRWAGLAVVTPGGGRLSFGRSLARSALKFVPWEIGHLFANQLYGHANDTPDAPLPGWLWFVFGVSMGTALVYGASLFVGDGRTPYDRLAGTRVVTR